MSTRYNTGNPIESTDVRDMSDNAKNFDEFCNSTSDIFTDRFGNGRLTIEGAIEKTGFKPGDGDFSTGFTVMPGERNIAWYNPSPAGDNNWYSYLGDIPSPSGHFVSPGTDPTVGGIWKPVTDNISTNNVIYVRNYQSVWDGITDNTDAIMAAHSIANTSNKSVSYSGIEKYAIDADAQIHINTNTDFCGAQANILNGVVVTPSFSTFKKTFIISDPLAMVTTAIGTFTGSLARGSRTPTKGLFNGPGYALIECGYQIPDRPATAP